MPETTEPQLTEAQITEIEARADAATEGPWEYAAPFAICVPHLRRGPSKQLLVELPDHVQPLTDPQTVQCESDYTFIAHARTDIPALIRDLRALQARVVELESSVTFWQAEALLNHFCSEHAKNTRQIGHYCTICTKPFVMSVPQGERPPKYKDLIAENAALREQLTEAQQRLIEYERLENAVNAISERVLIPEVLTAMEKLKERR